MALASYADLQAAIANYLARPGDPLVAAPAPDFVTLAESRIAYGSEGQWPCRPLRIRAMETAAILITGPTQSAAAPSSGSANAQAVSLSAAPTLARGLTTSFVAGFSNTGAMTLNLQGTGDIAVKKACLPIFSPGISWPAAHTAHGTARSITWCRAGRSRAGFLQMKSIFLQTSPVRQLSPVTPETYNSTYVSTSSGQPRAYDLEGDCIRFGPIPDAAYSVAMLFYRKFGALSAAVNWLYANKPDVYLFPAAGGCVYFGNDGT
jgi:hypothetical protein